MPDRSIVDAYLSGTPFDRLLSARVPYKIPDELWPTGTHIVAPPRRGKTTLMRALIMDEVMRVARGEATIILIDAKDHPTESLVGPLRKLKYFAKDQALHERITIIDPSSTYPPALNPFDFGHLENVPEDDRDTFRSNLLDFMEHIFGGMMTDFSFTPSQAVCFVKAVDAVFSLPAEKRRFQSLRGILSGEGKQYLPDLPAKHQRFINVELKGQYEKRKEEINTRLDYILVRWPTLEKMFSAPTNELKLREQMDEGRFIILNTSRARLGEGCCMFGRLFINMIRAAAFQRKSNIPVRVFIDECHDYVATDKKLAQILDQCRSFNICPIFAHQRMGQLQNAEVNEAIMTCGIKLANHEQENARQLAPRFQVEPERLDLPQGQFVLKLAGRKAVTVNVPDIPIPKMTDVEELDLIAKMRKQYCWTPESTAAEPILHTPKPSRRPPTEWTEE